MHRIDTPGSVLGRFSEGNPAIGQRATRVGADWLNDFQDNIIQLLAEAGVAPTKGRAADVTDAVKKIVQGVIGAGATTNTSTGSGASPTPAGTPTARKIDTTGLLTGGGDFTADRTFTVLRASAAEIVAGTEDGKVITPAGLFASIASGLDGRSARFGPLILKAGEVVGAYNESAVYVPFPTPFPSACWYAGSTPRNDTGSNQRDFSCQLVGAPSAAGFTTKLQWAGGNGSNSIDGFNWFAIGL